MMGEIASSIISPGSILVVDESLFSYEGKSDAKRYLPRKPNPNGFLVYGLSGFFNVNHQRLPFVLDMEPIVMGNEIAAQEAMMRLFTRLRTRSPLLRPHLVVDSAFGSFDKLAQIVESGGDATMSMSSLTKPWLWELLNWRCGLDQGRAAFTPRGNLVVSSFQVESDTSKDIHQIKTISSGFSITEREMLEEEVILVSARREEQHTLEYLTHFSGGDTLWQEATCFIDDDGTVNSAWLSFADASDLEDAFVGYSLEGLRVGLVHPLFLTYSSGSVAHNNGNLLEINKLY